MVSAVGALPAAAGNPEQLKTAFGAAAGTCKACHDDFRRD
jgi:cytochrome c556